MRYSQFTNEAENGTKSAKEIENRLKKLGYVMLGDGNDATVWKKDDGVVIKIIMPQSSKDRDTAANVFYKFYEFCIKNPQYENLPKFVLIGNDHHTTFNIGDKKYVQIAMEELYPIPDDSLTSAVIWLMSDLSSKRIDWNRAYPLLLDINSWKLLDEPPSKEQVVSFIKSWDKMQKAKWGVLYSLMTVLYHTGRINKFGWDLHTANVMQRKNGTLVITDPWIYMGEFDMED